MRGGKHGQEGFAPLDPPPRGVAPWNLSVGLAQKGFRGRGPWRGFQGGSAPLVFLAALMLATPARAVSDPGEMLANPVLERRAEAIGEQLRCLVCQNESVEQSDADLAKDFRRIIRQRVSAGESNRQVIAWMVARYGNFIRLRPPFEPMTLVLWGAPFIAVSVGVIAVLLGRRRTPPAPAPLSTAERQRLADLLE